MNRKKYLEMRNKLLAEAEALVEDGKFDEANEKEAEIKALDEKWDNIKTAKANLEALKDNQIGKSLEDNDLGIEENKVVDFMNMEKDELHENDVYRNAYLKRLQGKELTKLENAAITADDTIPTQTMNKIVEKLEQTSVLYSRVTVSFFPNKLSIPVEDTKNDASWVAMATASTDSEDTFSAISLGAHKLIKTIEIEADVKAMSIPVFENFIVNALSKKMSKAIENAIINGTGTNQPKGLALAGQITETGTYTLAGMTYTDLMTLLGTLPTSYHPNAVLVMPRALFFSDVMGMTDLDGNPIVKTDVESPSKFTVLGYPVIINDFMPEDTIIFGDVSYYYFNWAKPVEISSDNSVGFRSGSTVYRGLALADGANTVDEAFVKYTRATS